MNPRALARRCRPLSLSAGPDLACPWTSLLQPPWLSSCRADGRSMLPPQGLCTCCSAVWKAPSMTGSFSAFSCAPDTTFLERLPLASRRVLFSVKAPFPPLQAASPSAIVIPLFLRNISLGRGISCLVDRHVPRAKPGVGWSRVLSGSPGWMTGWTDLRDLRSAEPCRLPRVLPSSPGHSGR